MATRTRRDYYAVLGVRRDADAVAIKKAFRALASELHPDVSSEPDADERFRELAEAYEVLSRPETRERYDRFGSVTRGVSGFAPGTFDGLFDDLVEASGAPRPGQRGADVRVETALDFTEAARGTSRGLRYAVIAPCDACGGEGTKPGGSWRVCPSCGGGGRIRALGGAESKRVVQYSLCERCNASGRLVIDPCDECDGRGRVEEERTVLVEIPPRTADGARILLAGQGFAGGPGGTSGDVVVEVRVAPLPDSPLFRRLAGAGAICAALLLLVTLLVLHQ